MSPTVAEAYASVRQRMTAACERAGRSVDAVRLVAISKAFFILGQRTHQFIVAAPQGQTGVNRQARHILAHLFVDLGQERLVT